MKTSDVHRQVAEQLAGDKLTLYTQLREREVIERLGAIYDLQIRLANEKLHTVDRARTLGISWERIARELNMSRQAAWEQWQHVERR